MMKPSTKKIMEFMKSLSKEELHELIDFVQLITDPLSQELLRKAAEEE